MMQRMTKEQMWILPKANIIQKGPHLSAVKCGFFVGADDFDSICIFAPGENYGVAAVEPAASDSPLDCRIWMGSSPVTFC